MFHAAHMVISKKLGPQKSHFAFMKISLIELPDCHVILQKFQQYLAKRHSIKI
jgi:hypothetical protein